SGTSACTMNAAGRERFSCRTLGLVYRIVLRDGDPTARRCRWRRGRSWTERIATEAHPGRRIVRGESAASADAAPRRRRSMIVSRQGDVMPQSLHARPRVYVVEDSRILCNVLCEALGAAGAEVVGSCDTADAAVRDIEALHPDAVMIDIALRRGTGFDV